MRGLRGRGAAALLLALTGCGTCGKEPAPPAPVSGPPAPARARVQVEVTSARGEVEYRRGASGAYLPASGGMTLGLEDALRTGAGSSAALSVGSDGTIFLRERTEVSVKQLLVDRSRFRLERGRLAATPGKSRMKMAVESSGSSAVAEASSGSFAVFNDGHGLVAVVAEAGEVKLSSKGGDAVLAAGEGAQVQGSAAPHREAVPRSVLLKVAWPSEKVSRQETMVVRGEADPGASVSVNGRDAQVSADGSFEAEVPLAPGQNRISVSSTDRFGRTAGDAALLQVDRKPPPVKVDLEGWK